MVTSSDTDHIALSSSTVAVVHFVRSPTSSAIYGIARILHQRTCNMHEPGGGMGEPPWLLEAQQTYVDGAIAAGRNDVDALSKCATREYVVLLGCAGLVSQCRCDTPTLSSMP